MSRDFRAQVPLADETQAYAGEPDIYDDAPEAAASGPSSGLIRAGLVGAVLFLGVFATVTLTKSWLARPAAPGVENARLTIAQEPEALPPVDRYQALRDTWVTQREMLDTENANRAQAQAAVDEATKAILRHEKELAASETALVAARQAVSEAREAHAAGGEALAALQSDSPARAVETAQLAVDGAMEEARRAQTDLAAAKTEEARVRAAVTELRKAAKAAEAASRAAAAVVGAANKAAAAVASNQDVMAAADAPTLSSLENDFFREAQTRADTAERSAQAARQAVRVAEMRLDILEEQKSIYQSRFAEANQLEQEANVALARARETAERHRAQISAAEAAQSATGDRLATLETRADSAETARDTRGAELTALQKARSAARGAVERADTTVAKLNRDFAQTETDLKAEQRKHAERAAVAIALGNATLNERLHGALDVGPKGQPIFDRFVMSSEQLFDTGSAVINPRGRELLSQVVPILKDVVGNLPGGVDWVLRVDGHTDRQPLSGTGRFRDNWELSQARALSVVKYLIGEGALSAQYLSANGFGEFQPLDQDDTALAHAKNRRIELTLAAR
ncbi:MAG: OmpA family protein [Pseudomonadota bacterium]